MVDIRYRVTNLRRSWGTYLLEVIGAIDSASRITCFRGWKASLFNLRSLLPSPAFWELAHDIKREWQLAPSYGMLQTFVCREDGFQAAKWSVRDLVARSDAQIFSIP